MLINWILTEKIFIIAHFLIFTACIAAAQEHSWSKTAGHLRLADNLDRPQDGYCLDIVGSGQHIRSDLPLIAHNCKEGLYADEAVKFEQYGYIRFPTFDKCATVGCFLKRRQLSR